MDAVLDPGAEWGKLEPVVRGTVGAFVRRYGGRFDDLLADASVYYMRAFESYTGDVNLEAHLRRWVWYGLFDEYRTRVRRSVAHREVGGEVLDTLVDTMHCLDWTEGLSEDAATAVRLVLDAPADLLAMAKGKGDQPRNWRSSLRDYLGRLGWTAARITESFEEIRDALTA